MNHINQTKCIHCGVLLNHTDDQPCHKCGRTGRELYATVQETIGVRDDFVIGSTSGKTNRTTIHADSRNPTDTVKIQKLIISFVENEVDDLTSYIDALVKKI